RRRVRVVRGSRGVGVRAGARARRRDLQAARRAETGRARSRLGLPDLERLTDVDRRRENLVRDPLAVVVGKLPLRLGHRERNPIGQLEAALLAQRVDLVNELVRLSLEDELVVEAE